jgi:L-ascorbate metabolism protein UlaG (beta-lactamase superfamily)
MVRTVVRALMVLAVSSIAPGHALDACRLITQHAPAAVPVSAAPVARDEVRLTFIGHSTFLIETQRGVTVETDYNDYVRSGVVPTIATMNRAHSTHHSFNPDPGIAHVLRGWRDDGVPGPAEHDLTIADLRVRNVATNIRGFGGDTARDLNSIFVFESAGLCIGHLGHLHHTLSREHLRELGRIDVLLVPVDGSFTLDLDGMMEVVTALQSSIVVPMHMFSPWTLARFVDRARGQFRIDRAASPHLIVSRGRLPAEPTIVVLPGAHPRYERIVRSWTDRSN